jgi:hypothetical protein
VICVAAGEQALGRCAVAIQALRLKIRGVRTADVGALIPRQAQPPQAVEDPRDHVGRRALRIGILDPQDERAAVAPRVQPVEQRRPGSPDVEITGRRRRKTHPRAHAAIMTHRSASGWWTWVVAAGVLLAGSMGPALVRRRSTHTAGTAPDSSIVMH